MMRDVFGQQLKYSPCVLCTGVFVSLTPVTLNDLFGMEQLNYTFGLVALFQCAGAAIGPPLAGQ